MIRFGACQCCSVLKEEVNFLRSLIRPKPQAHNPLPIITFEADQIIGGGDHQTEFKRTPEEVKRQEEIDSEAARILSATYE